MARVLWTRQSAFTRRSCPIDQRFRDRREAGERLAARLGAYAGRHDVFVFGLARGGVPVAAEVARHLGAPLDVLVVRKLGTPGQPELAMGAIALGGVRVLNQDVIDHLDLAPATVDRVATSEAAELDRRQLAYRGARPLPDLHGRTAILVDDGLATGATMRAAIESVRRLGAAAVVVAVPVAAPETIRRLTPEADAIVTVLAPSDLTAVGLYYDDFSQTTDEDVRGLLVAAESE